MKILSLFLLLSSAAFAEEILAVENPVEELVWFGLDYTQVKFIGAAEDFSELDEIRGHYFRSWNELVVVEREKYDIGGALGAVEVTYELEPAISRSEQRGMDGIRQLGPYSLDEQQVADVVQTYVDRSVDKVGALIVVETLNKIEENATMWLAIFQINSGEIIHLKRYSGKPGGFGFRNYWARSYYNVLTALKESPYKLL
jgi:hypothetical protein